MPTLQKSAANGRSYVETNWGHGKRRMNARSNTCHYHLQLMKMVTLGIQMTLGVLLASSLYMTVMGARRVWLCYSSAQWPSASGRIIAADIQRHEIDETGDGTPARSLKVVCRYSYSVSGIPYEGNTIGFTYTGGTADWHHERLLQKLEKMESVKIFYNPRNPAQSTLTTARNMVYDAFVLFGLVASCFIALVIVSLGLHGDNLASSIIAY